MANPIHASGPGGTKSHQLFLLLKDAIVSGRMPPGSKLPGEIKLAETHQLSRVTVRRAMSALAREGLVTRQPGVGTLVCEQPLGAMIMTASVSNLLPNIRKIGKESSVRLLEFGYDYPLDNIRERLRMLPEERTQKAIRVRQVGGKPFSYLTTHVPESIALSYNENELATSPLFVLLERSGVVLDHATQSISATLATTEVARELEVATGSPLIALTRVVYGKDGRGVEHLHALYCPDRYRIEIDLCRAGEENKRYWQPLVSD